jgi:hypothetical protein
MYGVGARGNTFHDRFGLAFDKSAQLLHLVTTWLSKYWGIHTASVPYLMDRPSTDSWGYRDPLPYPDRWVETLSPSP